MATLTQHYLQRAKNLISFTAPIAGSQLFNNLAGFFSVLFVAQLGKQALAAAALATVSYVTFMALGRSVFDAAGILISHQQEKKDNTTISKIFGTGILLSLIIGFILAIISWQMPSVLLLFGQDPHLVSLTVGYFHFAGWCMIPLLLTKMIEQFYIGTSKPRYALYMSLIKVPFIIVLSYALILGKWGLPQMGLSGLMLALLLTQSIFLIIFIMILFYSIHNNYGPFKFNYFVNVNIGFKILKLGIPMSMQTGSELIAITITTYFMGWFGSDGLAAAQIVNQYVVLALMIYIGLSQAMAILTSKAHAKGDYTLIKEYTQTGMALMTLFFIVVAIIFTLFPTSLIDIFLKSSQIHHDKIVALGKIFFIIAIITNFADSIRFILSGAYRGLHDSKKPMYVGIFCLWGITLTSSYLLGVTFNIGPIGIRLGICLGIVCAALYLLYDFFGHKLSLIAKPISKNT